MKFEKNTRFEILNSDNLSSLELFCLKLFILQIKSDSLFGLEYCWPFCWLGLFLYKVWSIGKLLKTLLL